MIPTKAEIGAAVVDTERALFDFTSAFADGTLGDMDADAASDLTRRASESVHVAANAFGVDAGDLTPDGLRDHMDDVYAGAFVSNMMRRELATAGAREAARFAGIRSDMASVLGLSDADIERMDFDEENGDPSAWLRAKERFVFR